MSTAEAITETDAAPALPAPRLRWAAIIWGTVCAAIAGYGLWTLTSADRRDALRMWVTELTVASAIAYGLLAVGALVVILGLIGLLRRAQR